MLRLPEFNMVELCARASRTARYCHGKPGVESPRHKSGLAVSGKSNGGGLLRIKERLGLNPVKDAAHTPRPCGEDPPLCWLAVQEILRTEHLEYASRRHIGASPVLRDLLVAVCCNGKAARHDVVNRKPIDRTRTIYLVCRFRWSRT